MSIAPEDVLRIEQLAEQLFAHEDVNVRNAANAELASFATPNKEGLLRLHSILDMCSTPYAQFFSASALVRLVTDHWNSLSETERIDLRNWLVSFLAERGPNIASFVLSEVVQLLCRLTKFGWNEDKVFQSLPDQMSEFLTLSIDHMAIALNTLSMCISEMNTVNTRRTLTQHRKVAISFRDQSLLSIFNLALKTLYQCVNKELNASADREANVRSSALGLTYQCLSFDFVGIFPDESTEEVGTVQMPLNWRPIIQNLDNLDLFFNLYFTAHTPDQGRLALQCVTQLASVRRSLFASENDRKAFLSRLLQKTNEIMQSQHGFQEDVLFHELCRLMSRIKGNFQLTEIVGADEYDAWINFAANLTVASFSQWEFGSNADYYLMNFWSRMVATLPYLKGKKPSRLEQYVPQIVQAYVESRLTMARAVCHNDEYDNPLEEEENLLSQLDGFPQLVRTFYETLAPYFAGIIDPLLETYSQGIMSLQSGMNQNAVAEVEIIESQIAWMNYMVGCVIGHRLSASSSESLDLFDGELSSRVLQCTQGVEQRISLMADYGGNYNTSSLEFLESSVIYFFNQFRRVYIGEQAMSTSRVYVKLQELLGLNDHSAVLGVIVNKIVSNLKTWSRKDRIVQNTLSLLHDLSVGYSSGKMLLKLDAVQYIVENHASDEFGFINSVSNLKSRGTFYAALTKLLVSEPEIEARFEVFLQPMDNVSNQIQSLSPNQFSNADVQHALLGWLCDLRGILGALLNRRNYALFFDWFFPAHMPLLEKAIEFAGGNPEIAKSALSLLADLVHNRSDRILFDSSSPNGILLFKHTSKILFSYGNQVLSTDVRNDPYYEKYRGIYVTMNCLSRALLGNYCNFGVFQLYNDPALVDAIDICIRMAISIPLSDLMAYQKLTKAYFHLLQTLFHRYMHIIVEFDTPIFLQLLISLETGIQSLDSSISSQSCVALDHVVSFYFKEGSKQTELYGRMQQHLSEKPDLFPMMLRLLINMILFEESNNQWSLSRPLLSLIVTHPMEFDRVKEEVASTLNQNSHATLYEAFDRLMDKVNPSLETRNRDIFTQNMTVFRTSVKSFL